MRLLRHAFTPHVMVEIELDVLTNASSADDELAV